MHIFSILYTILCLEAPIEFVVCVTKHGLKFGYVIDYYRVDDTTVALLDTGTRDSKGSIG